MHSYLSPKLGGVITELPKNKYGDVLCKIFVFEKNGAFDLDFPLPTKSEARGIASEFWKRLEQSLPAGKDFKYNLTILNEPTIETMQKKTKEFSDQNQGEQI